MGLYQEKCGFGKRKVSVTGTKAKKREMVKLMVRKLKAAGKPVDREAINLEVLDLMKRKKMSHKPKHAV